MDQFLVEFRLYAMVALGIGLVIFVHELGHFLAARWCGVRVETFSLGFGPKLIGWTRGGTSYQLSLVPLGGYVKMAGEESSGSTPGPDELGSKSVGQRFLIFSGGVLMNVIFALVVFPIIMLVGVPLSEPLVGGTIPGTPAWQAGLQPGTRVLSVNGNEVYQFGHILNEVALGSPERTELVVLEPGAKEPRTIELTPVKNGALGFYAIGVHGAVDPNGTLEVDRASAAGKAGLESGDRLVAVHDAPPGLSLEEQVMAARMLGGAMRVRVRHADGREADVTVTPEPSKKGERRLGLEPVAALVADLRGTATTLDLRKDDRIVSINGKAVLREYDLLVALQTTAIGSRPVIRVERNREFVDVQGPVFAEGDALRLFRDIGLARVNDGAIVAVSPQHAAARAGVRDGDRIVAVGDKPIAKFQDIVDANKQTKAGAEVVLGVERTNEAGQTERLSIPVTPAEIFPAVYGFDVREATYVKQVNSPIEAVRVGITSSWRFIEESWLTLKRILLGHVDSKNIGGIITIGVVSHSWAADGWPKLLFFLCMLSMNLAFLNVLPIPVLDGGHLLFLLVEKIKGSPVSERVMGYSQMVGVVLIVSLMVYVMYNDVRRWIVPG